MKDNNPIELTKLQVVCSLFSKTVGDDLYYAQQIKETIEASLSQNESSETAPFLRRAQELVDKIEGRHAEKGLSIVDTNPTGASYSMLDLRSKLLSALKDICRFDSGLVVILGLKDAICPPGRRWSKRRKQEYEDAVAFARSFCQQRSRPSSTLSLIII